MNDLIVPFGLVAAALAVGVLPGTLLTLLWKPRAGMSWLETMGLGTAVSFGVVQILTILAISAHLPPQAILGILGAACVAMAAVVAYRRGFGVAFHLDELILALFLTVLGVFLYRLGSPVEWFEDQVHVAIVRRLSTLQAPRLDNIYFAPGIVYTYPFPGTHYFMALVARLSDLDPLFVYQKLRFFWGPAAILMLYLLARAAFGSVALACGTAITAVVLVFSGAFGLVPGFPSGWGQLMPFSHASDVAMTVLLPASIVLACRYLLAESSRERSFFFVTSAGLVLMLTMVHVREVVQLVVYIGCFLVTAVVLPRFRAYVLRTAVMLLLIVGIVVAYVAWQTQTASVVGDVVTDQRARLVNVVTNSSWQALLLTPAATLLDEFVLNSEQLFVGLTPLFLFAGPAILVWFRTHPVVWLMAISTVAFLVVMHVPLLAALYIYFTYFEILFTPVRNVIFFAYVCAGGLIYLSVAWLARMDRTGVLAFVAGTAAGALALLVALTINHTVSGLVMPLIAGYVLAMMLALSPRPSWGRNGRSIVAVTLAALAFVALWPQREPAVRTTQVAVRWSGGLSDADRTELETRFSLRDGEPNSNRTADVNVWNYSLSNTDQDNVRALVTHPEVVDTGGIERDTFSVPPQPPASDDPYLALVHIPLVQYPGPLLFASAALFLWAVGLVGPMALASRRTDTPVSNVDSLLAVPCYRIAVPYFLFLMPFVFFTARPTLSPLSAPDGPDMSTPGVMIAGMPCLTTEERAAPFSEDLLNGEGLMLPERTSCPPDAGVIEWIRNHVPTDGVFAIDRWNPYLPSVFIPQQVVVYPQVEEAFESEQELFGRYYGFYNSRLRTLRVQPFFNSLESPEDRAAFVESLGVTHILVDPAYYAEMRAALDVLPDRFALRYSRGDWAVYEVLPSRMPGPNV